MFEGIRAAIFDLDGTLLDSLSVWSDVDSAFLFECGQSVVPEDYVRAIAPLGHHDAALYTIERFGLKDTPESVMARWQALAQEAYQFHLPLKPFAKEYLLQLQAQGIRLGVATASQPALFEPALNRTGIAPLFESVTTLHEVARGKGFADIYLCAAQKLGVLPAACAVFEDLLPGLCASKAAGFYTVGVYDPVAKADWPQIQAAAHPSILSFQELLV
jgi:HAD superfamily hydrolase (TIGR01509 family)